jgi:transposase-like protein
MMQRYYPTLDAISQQTRQLDDVPCLHCRKSKHLVSHGFIYKKQAVATAPKPVGKRVLCSQRYGRSGCGRTIQLYLASVIRYLHYDGRAVVCFVLALMTGMTIAKAYQQATSTADPCNAYRWLKKLLMRLSDYRSLSHGVAFKDIERDHNDVTPLRRCLLFSTFDRLLQRFAEPLCATFQHTLQVSLL